MDDNAQLSKDKQSHTIANTQHTHMATAIQSQHDVSYPLYLSISPYFSSLSTEKVHGHSGRDSIQYITSLNLNIQLHFNPLLPLLQNNTVGRVLITRFYWLRIASFSYIYRFTQNKHVL